MKNKNPFIKRAALAAVLLAGSTAWLVARPPPTNQLDRLSGHTDKQDRLGKQPGNTNLSTPSASQPVKILKASSLMGIMVQNQRGEDVGCIRDLVIDFNASRVAYCVLGVSSGVPSSEKLHAVPLRALQPSADGTSLTLNVEKENLARSESFDENNWPNMNNPAWGAGNPWDEKPGHTTSNPQSPKPPMKINKASSLIGATVNNQQGEGVGKIQDLLIDFNADRVVCYVVGSGSGLPNSENLRVVPMRAVQPSADGMSLTVGPRFTSPPPPMPPPRQ